VSETPRAETAPAVVSTRFAIRFESEPSGASVWESDRLLGVTPFDYAIEHEKRFEKSEVVRGSCGGLHAIRHQPGDSKQNNVVVMARLVPAPAPVPSVNPSPAPIVQGVPRSTRQIKGATTRNAAQPPNTLPNDIRMQR